MLMLANFLVTLYCHYSSSICYKTDPEVNEDDYGEGKSMRNIWKVASLSKSLLGYDNNPSF